MVSTKATIFIFVLFLGACGGIMIYTINSFFSPYSVEVNGNSAESVTYYLGDKIYAEGGSNFYFHGFTQPLTVKYPELLIAHSFGTGRLSNIHVRIERWDIIRIKSQSFKIYDYGESWITLERI